MIQVDAMLPGREGRFLAGGAVRVDFGSDPFSVETWTGWWKAKVLGAKKTSTWSKKRR